MSQVGKLCTLKQSFPYKRPLLPEVREVEKLIQRRSWIPRIRYRTAQISLREEMRVKFVANQRERVDPFESTRGNNTTRPLRGVRRSACESGPVLVTRIRSHRWWAFPPRRERMLASVHIFVQYTIRKYTGCNIN